MASLIYSFIMLAIQSASAGQGPPPPSQNRGPQLPIDDNLWILLVVGIVIWNYIYFIKEAVLQIRLHKIFYILSNNVKFKIYFGPHFNFLKTCILKSVGNYSNTKFSFFRINYR